VGLPEWCAATEYGIGPSGAKGIYSRENNALTGISNTFAFARYSESTHRLGRA
jgi:hypothetical protein